MEWRHVTAIRPHMTATSLATPHIGVECGGDGAGLLGSMICSSNQQTPACFTDSSYLKGQYATNLSTPREALARPPSRSFGVAGEALRHAEHNHCSCREAFASNSSFALAGLAYCLSPGDSHQVATLSIRVSTAGTWRYPFHHKCLHVFHRSTVNLWLSQTVRTSGASQLDRAHCLCTARGHAAL
jgi:hypothetical protein